MSKERLDLYLVNNNFASTRSKAAELIKAKKVSVDGKVITKCGFEVSGTEKVDVAENDLLNYVSRGGLKLKKAVDTFHVPLKDKVICDIGSSTGGFTDCSLKEGAKKVYAIDVGTDQLDDSLRKDERVVSLENTNFKDVTKDMFDEEIDLYVCDVSFIAIEKILLKLQELEEKFHIIILYKPQFEVGKENLKPTGVVKNNKILSEYLKRFGLFLKENKIGILNYSYSPILGNKEGNIEFLFELDYPNPQIISIDYEKLVEEAYKNLKVK